MQTWAKRGLQTALVTGGLLMLGTGIASAQENVNPDAPPNPLDAKVRVPVDVDHNNLGTPAGNRDLPSFHRELGTPSLSSTPAGRLAAPANPLVGSAQTRLQAVDTSGAARGNSAGADVVMPVSACGNAIAAGGDAYSEGGCARSVGSTSDVRTTGSYGPLSGNVARGAAAISPQFSGNAIAGGANAETRGASDQQSTAGGDIQTSGQDGSLSGNIAAVQGAVPVQVTNNAVAAGGNSQTRAGASNRADATGALRTDGKRSSGGGNVIGVPLAPIVAVSGNGVGAAGNADAVADNRSSADAGETYPDRRGTEMWATTSGDDGTLAGNVVQPAFAGPVSAGDNAVGGGGNSRVTSSASHDAQAGGNSVTSGQDSVLSGNFADAPVALPVSSAGNAMSGAGSTSAKHSNDATAIAGGDTYTDGDRSVLSANSANLPPAGAVDLCGNGLTGGGIAHGECENDVTADAGGYNGTRGNDAIGSGNVGQVPVGLPAEAFGNGVGAAGTPSGRATENKTIRSGDVATSIDDNGTVSSNVISAPTAIGGQVFGNSGGVVANPSSKTDSDTKMDVGSAPKANGKHGSVSGNIVHVPTSNPAQVFGDSVVGVGNGKSDTTSSLESRSGGSAVTTGDEGSLSGNVLSVPQTSSPQVFGSAVGAGGNADSVSRNEFGSYSGGDVYTSGDRGSWSGNGLGSQSSVPLQLFGDSVAVAGTGESRTDNKADLLAGGEHMTSADDASWSGNLFTVPAGVEPSLHGNSVSGGGLASNTTSNKADSQSGGKTTTSGEGAFTAYDVELPTETVARVFGVPVEVLGIAITDTKDRDRLLTGDDSGKNVEAVEQTRGIYLPTGVDSLMGATEMPRTDLLLLLPGFRSPIGSPSLDELRGLPIQGLATRNLAQAGSAPLGPSTYASKRAVRALAAPSTGELPEVEVIKVGLPAGELPTTDLPTTDVPASGLPKVNPPAVEAPVQELPTGDLRTSAQPPVVSDAHVQSLLGLVAEVVDEALATTSAERSFVGTLPVLGGRDISPNAETAPTLNGLPLGASAQGRSLPTLPIAAPVALPVVVPTPGLAQPRTAVPAVPSVPSVPSAELSGMDVNPMKGVIDAPTAPVQERATHAPALAGLDARTVFGSLEETMQLPRI